MSDPEFLYVTFIETTQQRLWQALTTPEFTRQYWFDRAVESDFEVGSPISYRYDDGRKVDIAGQILAASPPRLLSYTFLLDGRPDEKPSRVTFESEQVGKVVKLTVTHDQFEPGSPTLPDVSDGWPEILCALKTLLETGRAMPLDWSALGSADTQRA